MTSAALSSRARRSPGPTLDPGLERCGSGRDGGIGIGDIGRGGPGRELASEGIVALIARAAARLALFAINQKSDVHVTLLPRART